jgi:F0F1-type ATP synthase assembly protein I
MNTPKGPNKWLVFLNIPFQMGIVILVGVLIGMKLDVFFGNENLFTIIFSLMSVFVALYSVFRNVNNLNKND